MAAPLSEVESTVIGPFATKVFDCDDLVCLVFSFVPSTDLPFFARVCKGFQRCANNPASWKALSYPQITERRWRYHSKKQLCDLFVQLVRVLSDRKCLAQVKMVRAFLRLEHLEAYQLLKEHCPLFVFGNPESKYDATACFGLGAGLVDAVGPHGDTLCIDDDKCYSLRNPIPSTILHLQLRTRVSPELIPKSLESLEIYSIRSLRNLQCLPTLRKLSITTPESIGRHYTLRPMLQLQILELDWVNPADLLQFTEACPNVESFVSRLDQLDQMRDCYRLENYIELLKRWQLKTLSLVLEGLFAADETRDYDTIRAYILQELPSVEHIELIDKRP
jgi:hypothetical protein